MRWWRTVLAAAVIVGGVAALSGCTELGAYPTAWTGSDGGHPVFLTWTDGGGSLTGTADVTVPGATDPNASGPGATVSAETLTGSENHSTITVHVGGSLLGSTLTGTIGYDKLTLSDTAGTTELVLQPSSLQKLRAAVAKVSASVMTARAANVKAAQEAAAQQAAEQQAAAQQQAEAQYQQVLNQIPGQVSTLTSDQAALQTALTALQRDYQTEEADKARSTCFSTDSSTAAGAALTVSYNIGSDAGNVNSAAATVNQDAQQLTNLLGQLNGLPQSMDTAAVETQTQQATTAATQASATATQAQTAATTGA